MKSPIIFRLVVCGLLLALVSPAVEVQAGKRKRTKIGVLVSLTRSWSTLGTNTVAALQIAADQIETATNGRKRFRLLVRDTQLDPSRALEAIKDLAQHGVKIVIGPQSSSEVAMIKPYADAHNILVISQGSTASSLAIPGDNIFRFCPNDTHEAEAIVALLRHDGIRAIVPLWRNDAGNNGLHDSVQIRFQALGGRVTSGFRYEPTTTNFSAATNSVASQIDNLISGGTPPSAVAVYLAAFDEVVGVFYSAQGNTTLSSTRWYGSDGVALSAALTSDATAASFAANAGYPNPIFGLSDALKSEWQPIANNIKRRTGITPDAFALSAYDALFVVQRALRHVKRVKKKFGKFKSAFVDEANSYHGVTGSTALDAAGDRVNSDFDFWAVRLQNGTYSWVRVATYNNGSLTVFAPPVIVSINFDAIDASANPVGGTTLQNYLAQFGVTISDVTAGTRVVVDDDRRSYGGGVVFAPSPHNFLSDYYLNAPNSFTLSLGTPVDSVNFTRIAGGPFPTLYASWSATALSASGQELSSVSESSPGTANFPAKIFTLSGPGIAKVRWDSDGFGVAAFSAVLLDDLTLNYSGTGHR
jgi:branched-chain amino acid transport system substrate-binding protein